MEVLGEVIWVMGGGARGGCAGGGGVHGICSLPKGYHHIHLTTTNGKPLPQASIFVYIEIQDQVSSQSHQLSYVVSASTLCYEGYGSCLCSCGRFLKLGCQR